MGGAKRTSGFTLAEMCVVIGVIMILIGLVVPVFGSVRARARLVTDTQRCADMGKAIMLYANSNRDTYPNHDENAFRSAVYWYKPLIADSTYASAIQLDGDSVSEWGEVSFRMSMAMVYDPEKMKPGRTVPVDTAKSTPVRQADVAFPSSKGLLFQQYVLSGRPRQLWCCDTTKRLPAPVMFADGASLQMSWQEFLPGVSSVYVENTIGLPVFSTWNGYLGRDRK